MSHLFTSISLELKTFEIDWLSFIYFLKNKKLKIQGH